MKEIRCKECKKLLARVKGTSFKIETKCPKCKKLHIHVEAQEAQG